MGGVGRRSKEGMMAALTPAWRAKCEAAGQLPSEVAETAGVTKSHVIAIMKGRVDHPGEDVLQAIERALHICPRCRQHLPAQKGPANAKSIRKPTRRTKKA